MKKLLLLIIAGLVTFSLNGKPRHYSEDARITHEILNDLKDAGYTVLPEVVVTAYRNDQDTLKHKQQRFSSRYETKGGRGYLLPDWANDSTWYPGQKPPKKEWDDLYFNPKTDQQRQPKHRSQVEQIVDTLVKENPNIQVNNYYNDDPFFYSNHINRFYHGGFSYWYYNPFFYDPWYFDYGWGWNPYYGYNYPYNNFYFGWNNYWGWNFGWNWGWNSYHPYYPSYYHNNYYGYNSGIHNNNYNVGRRDRPSNYTQNNPPSNRRFENTQPQRNRIEPPQSKPMYSQNRRSYTPSYETPRMGVRPNFNNSRTNNGTMNRGNTQNMEQRRENMGNMNGRMNGNMGNMNRGTMQNMPNSRREVAPQSRTYTPTQNREISSPSRSFNSENSMNRSSGMSNFSGGSNRSSSGSSSSGTSNSSGGHSATRR